MIGILLTGYIADTIGVSNAFWISGCIILSLGVISFFIPSVMKLENGVAKIVFSTKISDLYGYNSGNPVSLQERFWLFGVPLSL